LTRAPRIGALGLFLLARRSRIALRLLLIARPCMFGFCIVLHHNLLMSTTRTSQQQLDRLAAVAAIEAQDRRRRLYRSYSCEAPRRKRWRPSRQARRLQQYSCRFCKKENAMTDSPITTIRISDTELQVGRTLYSFASRSDADAFQSCLVNGSIETCYQSHPPVAVKPTMPDRQPDDPNRGSTISPSLGGMP
jgi:hypothetical protein